MYRPPAPWQGPLWAETPTQDRDPPGWRYPPPGTETETTPVNRITDTCKNINLRAVISLETNQWLEFQSHQPFESCIHLCRVYYFTLLFRCLVLNCHFLTFICIHFKGYCSTAKERTYWILFMLNTGSQVARVQTTLNRTWFCWNVWCEHQTKHPMAKSSSIINETCVCTFRTTKGNFISIKHDEREL